MGIRFLLKSINTAPYNGFRSWKRHISGRLQAEYEWSVLCRMSEGRKKQAFENPMPELSDWWSDFARGWRAAWAEHGYEDALAGRYEGGNYNNSEYDYGWLLGMKKMKKKGFISEKHKEILQQLLDERGCLLENV
jgi:hypothetical protein